tara:strand:+ start:1334 stop:1924 length:591 start_codon:yes stop_codon:yes gene_type:complete
VTPADRSQPGGQSLGNFLAVSFLPCCHAYQSADRGDDVLQPVIEFGRDQPQMLFCPLGFGDVDYMPDQPVILSVIAGQVPTMRIDPADKPIGPLDPALEGPVHPISKRCGVSGFDLLTILFHDVVEEIIEGPAVAQRFIAEDTVMREVAPRLARDGIQFPDPDVTSGHSHVEMLVSATALFHRLHHLLKTPLNSVS